MEPAPSDSDWRDIYQETVRDILEMYEHSPRYKVQPWGAGGPTREVGRLPRALQLACARREAEITMNRVANTRED